MTDAARVDVRAGEELAFICHQLGSQMPTQKLALMGYIQSAMTQCAVQVLVTLLQQKNMLSDAELEKRLAEAYDTFASQIRQNMILAPPSAPAVRPNGGG